jgi:transcriptional regulator with XRE-family HTH domain
MSGMKLSLEEKRILLGLNITYYRRAKNLTQLQLAEKVSVSGNYISQVERGIKSVSLATLAQISETLGVEERDLLDFSRRKNE